MERSQPILSLDSQDQGRRNGLKLVLFADGASSMLPVYVCGGAALVGQPTAYVIRDGRTVWVSPGQSVDFCEV